MYGLRHKYPVTRGCACNMWYADILSALADAQAGMTATELAAQIRGNSNLRRVYSYCRQLYLRGLLARVSNKINTVGRPTHQYTITAAGIQWVNRLLQQTAYMEGTDK